MADADDPCGECGFALWNPIETHHSLRAGDLGLYDDARFPGRCILRLREHATDLTQVSLATLSAFMEDIQIVMRAMYLATGADRVNIAILGNEQPHVHAHLIPRYRSREAQPNRTPWDDPRPPAKLQPAAKDFAIARISDLIMNTVERPITHPDATRVEVISESQRDYVRRFDTSGADVHVQDGGRTIKVFMEGGQR